MDEQTFHVAVKGHPMIRANRWYIGNTRGGAIVVDQPAVGFESEGACRMYIQNTGRHIDTSSYVAVPARLVG